VAWLLQGPYKPSKGSVFTRMGSKPLLSAYLLRRFAALNNTSLAHVTGLASSDSAADCICCFSASVSGMSMESVRRSSGALGGLPRLVFMQINISMKILASSLALPIYYLYKKCGQEKTLGSVGTRPRATTTGFRLIAASAISIIAKAPGKRDCNRVYASTSRRLSAHGSFSL
jgi:hypothetical protein